MLFTCFFQYLYSSLIPCIHCQSCLIWGIIFFVSLWVLLAFTLFVLPVFLLCSFILSQQIILSVLLCLIGLFVDLPCVPLPCSLISPVCLWTCALVYLPVLDCTSLPHVFFFLILLFCVCVCVPWLHLMFGSDQLWLKLTLCFKL